MSATFGGFIGPGNLAGLVSNTAPWLFDRSSARFQDPPETSGPRLPEHARHALGWWSVLRHARELGTPDEPTPAEWTDYFVLCLAAHFASVATYVPTDVDTKIRVHLWYRERPDEERARLRDAVLGLRDWDVRGVTARLVDVEGHGPISGHDGERLSVLAGGLIGFLVAGDAASAEALEQELDAELRREADAFELLSRKVGRERDLLSLAALLTHNVGDVDQGLSAREGRRHGQAQRERYADLAGRGVERYGGAFARAAALYRLALSADGHRHYPLREVRALRSSPELLLPLAPFLDEWGAKVATWPAFDAEARAGVVAALVDGCRKLKGQNGYYRALSGFQRAHPGGLEEKNLQSALPASVRRELRDSELRRLIAIRQESFESSLGKQARNALARFKT